MSSRRTLGRTRRVALAVLAAALGAVMLAATGSASPSSDGASSYIVIMAGDPVVAYEGDKPGLPATKPGKGKKVDPGNANVKKYRDHLRAEHTESLDAVGASARQKLNDYSIALNGYSALLTQAQVAELEARKDVVAVMKDELQQPTTDSSPAFLGLTAPGGAYAQGLNGAGVVVGVIDSGIWPEHPSFSGAGFPAPPVGPLPCEFGNTAHNPQDAPFTCNNKLIGARQMLATYRTLIGADPDEYDSARDDDGHGTHTASTAAGDANVSATVLGMPRGKVSGIAPRAHVVAYKALGNLGGFTSDLAAAIDQAVADGVDVINYSIGGGCCAIGADELAFLFANDAGVFVAASAGNSGPGPSTVGAPGQVPWLTTVGASTQSRFFQGTVVLGNGASYPGASITGGIATPKPLVDAAALGNPLCDPGLPFTGSVLGAIVICQRGAVGRVAKSQKVLLAGGVGMIMYENSNAGNLFSDTHFVPAVHVDYTPGLAIKAYAASASSPTARIVAQQVSTWAPAPSMTDFSSRGPLPGTFTDFVKPDVTAPGLQILAGASPTPDEGNVAGQLFQAIAGTSMSSPHVAGLFALLKQAHPEWSAAAAKSALMTTASQNVRDNDRVSQATPFAMGAGHVRPGRPQDKGSAFQPGLVYDAGFLDYLGALCDVSPSVFTNPTATCASLASAGIATKAYDLNQASIGIGNVPGSQTVERTVTSVASDNGNRKYQVSVTAPPGFSVTVSPSSFELKSGQSATYTVTITNVSAPIGQFRFGSLTWTDTSGSYKAYSPIAVRASQFLVPGEIDGSGVAGTADIPVRFGYTGPYSATSTGLVPATVTSDNVLQDDGQEFDPGDVGTGGANAHTFNLSNAAVFRIALPPEGAEANSDLDVFVYNPSNQLVASSTAGGTDELITLSDPADGTWTVYVHGWSAPGGSSNYTMYSWAVPKSGAVTLVTDSAPASATIGTVGTVTVDWTGATSGQWHLGAVTHSSGATVLGRTLVNVDNR